MNKQKTVLITGATGLVATALIPALLRAGYQVNTLSRKHIEQAGIRSFLWHIEKAEIDEEAVLTANIIIHLAGENVAGKAWSDAQKTSITNSRVNSTALLKSLLDKHQHSLECYIGASAIGYYGSQGTRLLDESSDPADAFLAQVCIAWEQAHHSLQAYCQRQVIFRIGIVLATNGGALASMLKTTPLMLNYLGNGKQIMSYIHIQDLVNMMCFALAEPKVTGTYHAVAPHPIDQKHFVKTLNKYKWTLLPNLPVPAWVLKIVMGESACIALDSQNCSSAKIQAAGYQYIYGTLDEACVALFKS